MTIGYYGTQSEIGSIAGRMQGTVEATGSYVGGIMGGGYGVNSSAPNGIRTTVTDCKVTDTASVTGQENVGGIKV